MRREHVHIAADVFLFEAFDQESPKLLKGQVLASFGGDLHDGFWAEDSFPQSQTQLLLEGHSQLSIDYQSHRVVRGDCGVRESFL